MESRQDGPLAVFHQLYPGAPAPCRADPTLSGSVSLRAHRHCEPISAASAFGWYLLPPVDFSLMSDGETTYWKLNLDEPWHPLEHAELFPGFAEHCRAQKPDWSESTALPPFLGRSVEPNLVQLWFGVVARTRTGWSLLVRPLANHPRDSRFDVLDGIIQTDWWSGPLVTPIRIRKTDEPIRFLHTRPFCQLQPVPTESYAAETLADFEIREGLASMPNDDWAAFLSSLPPGPDGDEFGRYRREARRRRSS